MVAGEAWEVPMGRVEELSFAELVQELAHYEHDAGPPDLEKAIRRRSIDARLMRLLCADAPVDERRASVRVPGEIAVKLYAGERALDGTILDLGEGGLRVRTGTPPPEGDAVDVELAVADQPPRASATVSWRRQLDDRVELGLCFLSQHETHRRRMRRLVIELLRRLPAGAGEAVKS
jgi:hypothetical protein